MLTSIPKVKTDLKSGQISGSRCGRQSEVLSPEGISQVRTKAREYPIRFLLWRPTVQRNGAEDRNLIAGSARSRGMKDGITEEIFADRRRRQFNRQLGEPAQNIRDKKNCCSVPAKVCIGRHTDRARRHHRRSDRF